RLGVSRNFARYHLPNILGDFLDNNNHIEFNVITSWSQFLIEKLRNDEINIAIVRGDFSWKDKKLLLNEEPLCIIYKTKIKKDSLPSLPRIHFQTDPNLQQIIDDWWNYNYNQPS